MIRVSLLGTVVIAATLVPSITAASPYSYGYWGFDLGATQITTGADAFADDFDDAGAGLRLFGGYRANRRLGVEAGLHDLGRYEQGNYRASYSALIIHGVAYAPVSNTIDLYGRIGGDISRLSERGDDFSTFTRKPIASAGVGLKVHVNPHLALRGGIDGYALEPRVRGPGGGDGETTSQRIGMGYLGLSALF